MGFFNFSKSNSTAEETYIAATIFDSGLPRKITEENALKVSAVKNSIELISGSIAQLPIYHYMEKSSEMIKQEDSAYTSILEKPSKYTNRVNFIKSLVQDYLLYGKAFIYLKGKELHHLKAKDINVRKYTTDGITVSRKEYVYSGLSRETILQESEVIVIDSATNGALIDSGDAIRVALYHQEYSESTFRNGAMPIGVLESASRLTQPAIDRLRSQWQTLYAGTKASGKTIILEEGLKYSPISMKPNELELTASKSAALGEIARVFNIPESMLNSKANKYASNEANNLYFLQYCLSPILANFEMALGEMLPQDGSFFFFDVQELLRPTTKELVETITKEFSAGIISKNEARFKLNMSKDNEDYTLLSLGSVIQYEDGSISVPNMGIIRGEKIEQLKEEELVDG